MDGLSLYIEENFLFLATLVKIALVLVALLQVAPIMIWVERRGSALLQKRLGPNRVGPLGLLQSLADGAKFIFKEDIIPGHVNKFFYVLAPVISVIPAFMTFAVIPFGSSLMTPSGVEVPLQITNLNVGFLYVFAIAALGVYGVIIGAWASNSKYSLFGGLRSTAQMVSYELTLALSIIGLVLVHSTLELPTIVEAQTQYWTLAGIPIPKWGIFYQPLGFLLFLVAIYAETNRLPFDLAEGESEIVAGYHLEYGAMKFGLFFLAEYTNMAVGAALVTCFFFGGYHLPGLDWLMAQMPPSWWIQEFLRVLIEVGTFTVKVCFFLWLFVWVRWTLPRFRYDQLMDLGWKIMLPLSLINIFVTAVWVYWLS